MSLSIPLPAGVSLGRWQQQPLLQVDTPACRARICLFGGQLLSFVPAGGDELLWLSPRVQALPAPIRGGVPLCWPWFGRQGAVQAGPAHGLARTAGWQLQAARREGDDIVLVLAAPEFPDWPLRLRQELRLGRRLEQLLLTDNLGERAVTLTQALHSYFRVGDVGRVAVEGLDGCDYLDKFEGYAARHRQHGDWWLDDPRDPGRCDRIYLEVGGRYRLRDPVLGRCIALTTSGSRSLVVWNPGAVGAAAMADVGPGWRDYLCLEAANAGPDTVVLAPGARHQLAQRVEWQPLA